MKRSDDVSAEDRIAYARRGTLGARERARLDRELAADPELRAAYAVGLDLDRSTAVRAGDEALVGRAADAALALATAQSRSPSTIVDKAHGPLAARLDASKKAFGGSSKARGVALGAVAVCIAGAAAAVSSDVVTGWLTDAKNTPAVAGGETNRAAQPAPPPAGTVASAARGAAPLPQERTPLAIPVDPRAAESSKPAPPTKKPVRVPETEPTPSALFTKANAARRAGDSGRARALYSRLISAHPDSEEAGLARVSLGKLLLQAGEASAAERQFRDYLSAGRGQLAEEALVSQAESLQKLGRTDAERAAWQRLLARYPGSVYSERARERLDVLRGRATTR